MSQSMHLEANDSPPNRHYDGPQYQANLGDRQSPPQQKDQGYNLQQKDQGYNNYRNSPPHSPPHGGEEQKVFRSFDLVTGRSKYYG